MEYWSILLSIIIGILGIHYLFKNFNVFKRHGLLHIPSFPILGNMTSVVFRRISFVDFFCTLYNAYPDAKYYGFYFTTNPIILLRDQEIIKMILVKNFDSFPNRNFEDFNEPLFTNNLFSLRGQKLRDVRALLSPFFTSSKIKNMFILMSECAADFVKSLVTLSADKSDMDIKDVFSRYTNDVIATCAFGIKIDSMKDATNKFYVYGKKAVNFTSGFGIIKILIHKAFPKLGAMLDLKFIDTRVSAFFKDIIKTTIATRDAENIIRPDMIQLMMDSRGRGDQRELNIDDMIAQAFVFFFGGFDTTATAMSFAAHEIATNPDVQIRLQQEIDKALEESNGEVTYETIYRLEYLEAVINEVLRKYPSMIFLERLCDKDYELPPTLPGEKPFIMRKGMVFWIPVFAIHQDEKYYENPKQFNPERFFNNKSYNNSSCYMPFGLGPRMCIANRFGLLEVKVLLFYLLAQCDLKLCAKASLPVKFNKKSLGIKPENGFWLNVQHRRNTKINGVFNS